MFVDQNWEYRWIIMMWAAPAFVNECANIYNCPGDRLCAPRKLEETQDFFPYMMECGLISFYSVEKTWR